MFVQLNDKVAKSAIVDPIPNGVIGIVIAREALISYSPMGLSDSTEDTTEQRRGLAKAVGEGIALLSMGESICYVCIAGMSRSVTLACLVSALWYGTSFDHQFQDLITGKDPNIGNPSSLRPLAKNMFPSLFV